MLFEVVAATTTDETVIMHVTLNLPLSIESNSQHQQQHSISAGSVKMSVSLPHGKHLGDVQTLSNVRKYIYVICRHISIIVEHKE